MVWRITSRGKRVTLQPPRYAGDGRLRIVVVDVVMDGLHLKLVRLVV